MESNHPDFWIRAPLFETFPQLLEFESEVRISTYAEVRRSYSSFQELEAEIMARKGKSILFELSDSELQVYCEGLKLKAATHSLREIDQWTVCLATH